MKKHLFIMTVGFIMVLFFASAEATEPLKFYRDQAGDQTFAIKTGTVNNYLLVASTNKAVVVPAGCNYAIFAANADIWVEMGSAATIPAGDVTDGTGSELNPTIRKVEPGRTIGIISESAAKVSITFYK